MTQVTPPTPSAPTPELNFFPMDPWSEDEPWITFVAHDPMCLIVVRRYLDVLQSLRMRTQVKETIDSIDERIHQVRDWLMKADAWRDANVPGAADAGRKRGSVKGVGQSPVINSSQVTEGQDLPKGVRVVENPVIVSEVIEPDRTSDGDEAQDHEADAHEETPTPEGDQTSAPGAPVTRPSSS